MNTSETLKIALKGVDIYVYIKLQTCKEISSNNVII